MFPVPKKYVAISRSPNSEDRSALYQSLKEYGRFTVLCWLMSPEPSPQAKLPLPTIEEIIYSDEFIQTRDAQQQLDCLVRKAKITEANVLFNQPDYRGPTRQPSLASCKTRAAYCKKFWLRSACQKSNPFTSQTAPWGL